MNFFSFSFLSGSSRSRSGSRSRSSSRSRSRSRSLSPAKPTKVSVSGLTKNVKREHLQEIFSAFGTVVFVDLPVERRSMCLLLPLIVDAHWCSSFHHWLTHFLFSPALFPFFFLCFFSSFLFPCSGGFHRGSGFVEFEKPEGAEKARNHMDEGQVDGNVIRVQFVVLPRNISRSTHPLFCSFNI